MSGSHQWLRNIAKSLLAKRHYIIVHYGTKHRAAWLDRAASISSERTLLLNYCEACQLISALKATEKIAGDLAEVGVAYGASARIIAEHASDRVLHLFDTFEGLPAPGEEDSTEFRQGLYRCDLQSVRSYLKGSKVCFYPGVFPQTAGPVSEKRFAFVHVDVDLYASTLACLEFFYPRLSPGGILISHDYLTADGVHSAFADFFATRPEPVIELTGQQCMMVKLG